MKCLSSNLILKFVKEYFNIRKLKKSLFKKFDITGILIRPPPIILIYQNNEFHIEPLLYKKKIIFNSLILNFLGRSKNSSNILSIMDRKSIIRKVIQSKNLVLLKISIYNLHQLKFVILLKILFLVNQMIYLIFSLQLEMISIIKIRLITLLVKIIT